MAGILGNTPTASKSGGGILYKAKLERMKTEDTAEAARRSKMGTSKNITSETITSVKPKNLVQFAQGAQQAMASAVPRTPIDQRLNLFPNSEEADNRKYIGANLIPAYEEDSPLKKAGKGIVNYGVGGALSLLGNVGGAPQQAMMQTSRAGTNAVLGKPQDFREMSFGKDLLGAKEDNIGTIAAAALLDPATYIGGGIVDDLSRAGFMGKASRPSTEMVQVLGESQQKLLAKMRAKLPLTKVEIETVNSTPELKALPEAKQYLMLPEGRITTPDVIEALPPKPTLDDLDVLKRKPSNAPMNKNYPNLESMDATDLKVLSSELATSKENLINEQIKWLKETSGHKPEGGMLFRGYDNEVVGKQGFMSKNDRWYQEWAKENGYRKPRVGEYREIAEKQLKEGYNTSNGHVPPDENFIFADEFAKNVDIELNSPMRQGKALNKAKQYLEAKDNLAHTTPKQYRKETPFTVAKSTVPPKVEGKYAKESFDVMNDAARQADNNPLGGKLPKAEPKPLGGELPKAGTPQGRVYGDTPKGDIPVGQNERGFSRNVRTDTAMPDDIRKSFDEDPLIYKQISNDDTLKKAQTIFEQGDEVATAELYRSLGSKEFKPESVPLSKLIAKQAMESGNVEKARQVLSETAEKLTEAGQFSQAAKILRESDPETFLMTIDKQIVKLNEQGLKQYGKKWTNVDLLPDEITAIQNIPRGNQQAYEEVWEQIGKRIATDLPSTKMEKFDAWRRMAMLLNPKTHIRNLGGNVIMMGMRKSGDTVGAAFEKVFGVKTGNRTKSFGWSLNKKVASKVDETWDIVKKDILGESRWEIDNLRALGREKNTFKKGLPTKAVEAITGHEFDRGALQWVNDLSLKTLNVEDNIFTKRAFKDALGQFMQANKLDEATDAAIAYAKRRAMESTYKQANKLATWINQAKQIPGAGKLVEAAIPFSKTPANIMKTAFEYSPAGLTKLIFSKGKPAAEVIETLSKGLTGTAIAGLGFALASMGAAKTQNSKSNKVSAIDAEMGEQAYSITTPQGSYTFDWAQPFAVPLAMGIAMYEGINNKDDLDFDAIMDSIAQGGDSFFNMSMLQNVKRFLGYGSTTENILGLPWNYVQQAWPSLFGQVAKTVDDTRRSAYDPNPTKQTLNQLKSRIPFASKSLEPSLNVWGEEQKQGGIVQQFVNPGYAKKASNDPVTKEVARLHGEFGNNDMLPKVAQNFTIGGKPTKLSPKDMTQFQREMGQMNYREIKELINSPKYSSMTDEEKMKEIKKIVGDNYDEVKEGIIQRNGLKPSK